MVVFENGAWRHLERPDFTGGEVKDISLLFFGPVPFIAFKDMSHGGRVSVMSYNGSNWSYVGEPGFSKGPVEDLSFDYVTDPYVAYRDMAMGGKLSVMNFNGFSWQYVGSPGFSGTEISSPAIAVQRGGPYVAFVDPSAGNRLSVMRYTGAVWEYFGKKGFSKTSAEKLSFAFLWGTPYISWSRQGGGISVSRCIGTDWVDFPDPPFKNAGSPFLFMHFGIAHMAFCDESDGGRIIIMKYE